MRIEDERMSDNVEDQRGYSGGGGGGFGIGGGSLSIGGVVLALVASYIFGVDPRMLLGMMQGNQPPQQAPAASAPAPHPPQGDAQAVFVARVLATTEDAWTQIFSEAGRRYQPPKLVLFRRSFPTACGMGQSAAGPFYCPADAKVYIDLSFYDVMRQRFHAAGDFAEAYVVAHEVGHHVQNLLGIARKVDAQRGRISQQAYNRLSVRMELQADCFAGVWANRTERTKRFLEPGDVEEAVRAATAIGDDALQKQATGHVVPDSFTHGSSAQRVRWLRAGLDSGDVNACDTFSAAQL
jgi:predicted metalloprotease